MTRERKVFLLTLFFTNWIYTIAETAAADRIMGGSWLDVFRPAELIPCYLIGFAVALWGVSDRCALRLQKKFFPGTIGSRAERLVFLILCAAVYEFIYGLFIQIYFVFLAPEGTRLFSHLIRGLFVPYLVCVLFNVLISLYIVPPIEKLVGRLIP